MRRTKFQNSVFTTGSSGALGAGDRGAYSYIPMSSGNPYTSNDYVFRWRQYTMMYETCWEARKIVRIIPEDALRKQWIAEDIPEEVARGIQGRLDSMGFLQTLKRSLILERLYGGCLSFLGIEDDQDDPEKIYHPRRGMKVRFCNAIPISRISRVDWDHDPLSEHYMRPNVFQINGQKVHTSRCLVWDGEPLFDPYDFALTNFRSNLAGFGPSKLAPLWDDIVKAVGTRQAAYQLIQTNNAILVAVSELQDLQGTTSGRQALTKLKDIANQLSMYNAALIDADKTQISQHSASFGSVPELIITFIQILAAASDIPATRFLGQAPGGLNATGDSDLENYYNVIDSYQVQRIEPQIRRTYDIFGYNMYPNQWGKLRQKLTFKWPPLWNLSELEEADRSMKVIDNVLKLRDAGLVDDVKVIQEINAKNALSVNLDETDIDLLGTPGVNSEPEPGETPKSPEEALQGLRNSVHFRNADSASLLISAAGYNPEDFDLEQFKKGFVVEQEHTDVTGGDKVKTAKIVLAHLTEKADYYTRLEKVENSKKYPRDLKPGDEIFDMTYGKLVVEKVRPFDPKYPKSQIIETNRGVRDWGPDRIMTVMNQITLHPHRTPTEAQSKAGNYKKHHLKLHGLDFSIENPQGSIRKGKDADGTEWSSTLPAHYGYVRRTEGADGDHVDAYIGPNEESELVFVIDQNNLDTGKFDEHKAVFGCLSMAQATDLYVRAFSDGKGQQRLGMISPIHVSQFKIWLESGNTKKPFMNEADFEEAKHKRASDGKFSKTGAGGEKPEKKKIDKDKKDQAAQSRWEGAMADKSPEQRQVFETARERGYRVPPAWDNVWINPDKDADLQVKGKDQKGRTQYIYSVTASNKAAAQKFARLKKFSKDLPKMEKQIESDFENSPEARVLYLIRKTGFRIGGEKATGAEKQAYGASTLTSEHVKVNGDEIQFDFVGKKGVRQQHTLKDAKLAKALEGKQGRLFETSPESVRAYLKKLGPYKVKDFRTYVATDTALQVIKQNSPPMPPKTGKEKEKMILAVAKQVAQKLGNTPAMARDSYIDPAVFNRWEVRA